MRLAIITMLLCATSLQAQEVPKLEWIQQQYAHFNLLWFDGKLPPAIIIYSDSVDNKAITTFHNKDFYIEFAPVHNLSETTTIMHLMHEMCHVKTWWQVDEQWERHSKSWQNCMRDLASKGAFDEYW